MAPHSSALAWTIPWMEEPGRLQSMGSLRVGHDSASSLLLFTFMHWRRKWQPTPVSLPGESQGWGNLLGCHLWGSTELDTTEATQQQQQRTKRKPQEDVSNVDHSYLGWDVLGVTQPSLRIFVRHLKNSVLVFTLIILHFLQGSLHCVEKKFI